jgi:hypothetical protein
MATLTKTTDLSLFAWADIATGSAALGTPLDVSTRLAAAVFIRVARRSGSAFTAGWPTVRIEASARASGNDAWTPLAEFQPAVGASLVNTTLNGAVSAGATSCVVASAANLAAGDLLFLGDASSANWELVRARSVSGTTVQFEEACTFAHAHAAPLTDQAEMYCAQLDLAAVARLRAVVDNANGGQTVAVQVLGVTGDSLG